MEVTSLGGGFQSAPRIYRQTANDSAAGESLANGSARPTGHPNHQLLETIVEPDVLAFIESTKSRVIETFLLSGAQNEAPKVRAKEAIETYSSADTQVAGVKGQSESGAAPVEGASETELNLVV